jgi:hypothetical protein
MHADVRIGRNRARQLGAFEPDEIDIDAVRGERLRVVPHTGAAAQIAEGNDDGSHGELAKEAVPTF